MLIQRNQPENSYESVDPVEAAKLLGAPSTGKVSLIKTEQVEYDMVNKKEDTKVYNNAILLLNTKRTKSLKIIRSELVSLSFVMWVSSNSSNKKIRQIIMKYADLVYFLSGEKNIKIKDAVFIYCCSF